MEESGEISEEEAIRIAQRKVLEALAQERGYTQEILDRILREAAIWTHEEFGRVWVVDFGSGDEILNDYFGSFFVYLSTTDGEVLKIEFGNG